MHDMLAKSKAYTVVLLRATRQRDDPAADRIVWEHGRRNFELRASGVLAIVCPVTDDSEWSGIAIFDASPEEVAAIMDGDPGVQAGIFTYEAHPVRGFPGSVLPG
ncbi:MAG: YciI family protein [Candidatus Dormiibacterota bacterium]